MFDFAQLKAEQLQDASVQAMLEREVSALERNDARLEAEALATWLIRNRSATPRELSTLRIRVILTALPLLSSEGVRNFLRGEGPTLSGYKDRVRARIELWGAGREEGITRELQQELELALKQKVMPAPSSALKSQTPNPKPQTPNSKFQTNSKPEIRRVPPIPSKIPVSPPVIAPQPPRVPVPPPRPPSVPPKAPVTPPAPPRVPVSPPPLRPASPPPQERKPETRNQMTHPPDGYPDSNPTTLHEDGYPETRTAAPSVFAPPSAPLPFAHPISSVRSVSVRTVSSGKPRMADIAPPPRLVSPVDELRRMDLEAFRKMGTPERATARVMEMINLLSRQSFGQRLEGIRAWRQSPLYQAYLNLGSDALRKSGGLVAVVSEDTLSETEFHAISELNRELRK